MADLNLDQMIQSWSELTKQEYDCTGRPRTWNNFQMGKVLSSLDLTRRSYVKFLQEVEPMLEVLRAKFEAEGEFRLGLKVHNLEIQVADLLKLLAI